MHSGGRRGLFFLDNLKDLKRGQAGGPFVDEFGTGAIRLVQRAGQIEGGAFLG